MPGFKRSRRRRTILIAAILAGVGALTAAVELLPNFPFGEKKALTKPIKKQDRIRS